MEQSLEHDLRVDELGQVIAGLAPLLAFALQLADRELTADEVAEVDTANEHLPAGVCRIHLESLLRALLLECLGFDEGDIAGIRVAEVAIVLEAFACMPHSDLDLVRLLPVRACQVNRLDFAYFCAHFRRLLCRFPDQAVPKAFVSHTQAQPPLDWDNGRTLSHVVELFLSRRLYLDHACRTACSCS
jgi:hypothetical protein